MLRIAGVTPSLCMVAWLVSGCANRLRQIEVVEEETRSERVSARVVVEGVESPLRSARPVLELARLEVVEDRTERRVVSQIEVTPYAGWRELYEVPAGAVSVPLSLGFNALNAVLLGYVPDAQVRAFTSWTYAALNPALNAESRRRVEQRRGEVLSSSIERTTREQRLPLADTAANVRLDAGPPSALRSDARGMLPFHLLEIVDPELELRPRKLVVELEGVAGSGPDIHELLIDRDLARRLHLARQAIRSIQQHLDHPRPLARAVFDLDRLGFEEYSLSLEDEIAVQFDDEPALLAEFSRELDRLYGTPPASLPPVGLEPLP